MERNVKRVRHDDLSELIDNLYREYIAHIPTDEYRKLLIKDKAMIKIRSAHIELCWQIEEIDKDTINAIENFSVMLKDISFGNLKVVDYARNKESDMDVVSVYIANAYEVI